MSDVYTEDLADFGSRERKMLAEILVKDLPSNWYDKGTKPAMNKNSGYVFLVNADCQCAMINPETDALEIFHSTPYNGHEGFIRDLLAEYDPDDLNNEDERYVRENAEIEGVQLPIAWKDSE